MYSKRPTLNMRISTMNTELVGMFKSSDIAILNVIGMILYGSLEEHLDVVAQLEFESKF